MNASAFKEGIVVKVILQFIGSSDGKKVYQALASKGIKILYTKETETLAIRVTILAEKEALYGILDRLNQSCYNDVRVVKSCRVRKCDICERCDYCCRIKKIFSFLCGKDA